MCLVTYKISLSSIDILLAKVKVNFFQKNKDPTSSWKISILKFYDVI